MKQLSELIPWFEYQDGLTSDNVVSRENGMTEEHYIATTGFNGANITFKLIAVRSEKGNYELFVQNLRAHIR